MSIGYNSETETVPFRFRFANVATASLLDTAKLLEDTRVYSTDMVDLAIAPILASPNGHF